jgi:hypothetical protein
MTKAQILEYKIRAVSAQLAQLGCTPEQIAQHIMQPKPRHRKRAKKAR